MPILDFMNEPKPPIADDHTHEEFDKLHEISRNLSLGSGNLQELENKLNSFCWRMEDLIEEVNESAIKISMLEDELKKMKVKK